jgi:hypothetical protein
LTENMMRSMPKVCSAARNGGSLKMPLVVSQTWSRMARLMGRFRCSDVECGDLVHARQHHRQHFSRMARLMGRFRCSMSSAETSSMRASITGSIFRGWRG